MNENSLSFHMLRVLDALMASACADVALWSGFTPPHSMIYKVVGFEHDSLHACHALSIVATHFFASRAWDKNVQMHWFSCGNDWRRFRNEPVQHGVEIWRVSDCSSHDIDLLLQELRQWLPRGVRDLFQDWHTFDFDAWPIGPPTQFCHYQRALLHRLHQQKAELPLFAMTRRNCFAEADVFVRIALRACQNEQLCNAARVYWVDESTLALVVPKHLQPTLIDAMASLKTSQQTKTIVNYC